MSWITDLGLPIYSDTFETEFVIWDDGVADWDDTNTEWDGATVALAPANGQGDVLLLWSNQWTIGDWTIAEGDVQTGQDLETACLVSLFTDKLATPDFVPTDGTTDRRGWWADLYREQPLGSNLWQLERAKKTRDTLGLARRYAQDALQWLVDDGVAATVEVDTMWLGRAGSTFLGIAIQLTKPDGSVTQFLYGWAWEGLATLTYSPTAPLALARQKVV